MKRHLQLRKKRKGLTFLKRQANRNIHLCFGKAGIILLEGAMLTSKQIETCRVLINRYLKKEGKIWIKVNCFKPITKKASETRMGKGKGGISHYVAPVKRNAILFEVGGSISTDLCISALKCIKGKLPVRSRIIFNDI